MDFGLSSGTERNLLVSLTDASDSKHREIISPIFTCLCITKSLLILIIRYYILVAEVRSCLSSACNTFASEFFAGP